MAKLWKNKRMLATIVAGSVVITAVILAGTFGWFTSGSELGGDTFTTGIVKLSDTASGGFNVYEFAGDRGINLEMQRELEAMDPDNANAAFAAYLRNLNWENWLEIGKWEELKLESDELQRDQAEKYEAYRTARNNFRTKAGEFRQALIDLGIAVDGEPQYDPPSPYDPEFQVIIFGRPYVNWVAFYIADAAYDAQFAIDYFNWMQEVFNAGLNAGATLVEREYLRGLRNAARDSFIEARDKYDEAMASLNSKGAYVLGDKNRVTPGSIIYGEFTIANESNVDTFFRISSDDGLVFNAPDTITAVVAGTDISGFTTLVEGADGYFYSPEKISGDVDDFKIILGAYVFGGANTDGYESHTLKIDNLVVEIIQASNNAVIFEWNDSAKLDSTFWND